MNESKRHGTRIFKKSTPNGKVTVYLGKRDFVDHLTHVDPIEGVVLVDAEYVKGRKVFIHLLCAFRHGRDGDEFHGIDWHRDLFLNTKQVYPPPGPADESTLHLKISRLQERLIRKLGPDSYPFTFKYCTSNIDAGYECVGSEGRTSLTCLILVCQLLKAKTRIPLRRQVNILTCVTYYNRRYRVGVLPTYTPASVSLLLHSSDVGKLYAVGRHKLAKNTKHACGAELRRETLDVTFTPCRVDYELKVYVVDEDGSRVQKRLTDWWCKQLKESRNEADDFVTVQWARKYVTIGLRNSVRMIVRKLTFAPDEAGPQPTTEVVRDFLMSLGSLRVEASLDKQKYFHGESIVVNVLVDNNSTKTVKKVKLIVRQYTVICLPNAGHYKCNVAEINSETYDQWLISGLWRFLLAFLLSLHREGFPIWPSQTGWCKVYRLCPLLADNRDKSGLALDGDLKNEDTNLASSTIVPTNSSREALGIVVQYKVKIRLVLGFGLSYIFRPDFRWYYCRVIVSSPFSREAVAKLRRGGSYRTRIAEHQSLVVVYSLGEAVCVALLLLLLPWPPLRRDESAAAAAAAAAGTVEVETRANLNCSLYQEKNLESLIIRICIDMPGSFDSVDAPGNLIAPLILPPFSDVCLELPFILTHPNPETGATTPGSGAEGAGDGLEDFHFTEAGRAGDESSGGEGVEGPALPPLPPQAPQPLTPNGGAGASRPQMGLLAKRAAGGGSAGSNSRGPKSPPNSHIAEFLHASEMPDGMAAFAPPPPSATGASTDAADVLETFLGMLESPPPSNSNGHSNGTHPQGHPPPSSPATSSALAISSTQGAASTNKCQQMDADDLIFEDFARLRLMQQQQQRQQGQQQGQRTAP
ncbi:putative beta-arrestin [Echinococcus granulosus]|uniref:Beta-arrestin n=1 Tax=Echinococcus granulosus TaxID=6210 RepID=W6V4P3_ECHGR|nr:putative beta-arrestin [Echinococcus granulosus]EUB61154.1 putative beta-arrestin [Echinococcus granulosus]